MFPRGVWQRGINIKEKQQSHLAARVVAGLIAGIFCGLFFGESCEVLKPIGDAFIKIMQITVLPTVVVSIVSGIGSIKRTDARNVLIKGGLVLLILWSLGVIAFFSMALAFPHIKQAFFFSNAGLTNAEGPNLIDVFIPYNPFRSLSEGEVPAVVLFCLLLGFALIADSRNRILLDPINCLKEALSSVTKLITNIIPFAVFAIASYSVGSLTFERLAQLQVYFISVIVLTVLLCSVVLPLIVQCFTNSGYKEILSSAASAVVLGFSTGNTFITLPLIVEGVQGLFKGGEEKQNIQSYSEILVPTGYAFPLLGNFVPFLFILFVAWFYKNPLELSDQLILIIAGIPSFFGSTQVSIPFLLDLLHLPADSYPLYTVAQPFLIFFAAALACMSLFSFASITVAIITGAGRIHLKKVIYSSVIIILAFFAVILGLKFGFASMLADTYTDDKTISSMELPNEIENSGDPLEIKVYQTPTQFYSAPTQELLNKDTFLRIKERNSLRIGYNANAIPFTFFNSKGSLVGFDVQMAYELARFVNVSRLEFIPVNYGSLADPLDKGECDIIMSAVTITPERLQEMMFTPSYMTLHLAFVVKDYNKKDFLSISEIQKMDDLKIAVLNGSAFLGVVPKLFPNASIVEIDSVNDFFNGDEADALIATAEEGSFMTLLYPFYDVAMPEPEDVCQILYAYPVSMNNNDLFLALLDHWIKLEGENGGIKEKYDYWILGKNINKKVQRWSILKNVLHWD